MVELPHSSVELNVRFKFDVSISTGCCLAESLFYEVLNCIGQIAKTRNGNGTPDNGLISHESKPHS